MTDKPNEDLGAHAFADEDDPSDRVLEVIQSFEAAEDQDEFQDRINAGSS